MVGKVQRLAESVSDLSDRCELTLDYRSRGYVEDARYYARWILALKASTPQQRAGMLRELDGEPALPDLKPGDLMPDEP